jgi:prevent-host-death family protein
VSEVSIRDARSQLKALLDRAAAGEEITVTRRGRPVARLVPPATAPRRLPSLARFRASLPPAGGRPAIPAAADPVSTAAIRGREDG